MQIKISARFESFFSLEDNNTNVNDLYKSLKTATNEVTKEVGVDIEKAIDSLDYGFLSLA